MLAVRLNQVSKSFPRHAGQILLRDRLMHLLRSRPQDRFYALRDISFQVEQGESVAVIGHNGAGKSTLLNLVTRLSRPNAGSVEVQGRVAALLELGSGFHPDLTGAENIHVNAALLGLSRQQTRRRFDGIVEFSEIGDFIHEPLRTYSSGMTMRLAFSVAVNMDPDILVIDEVLGVGDQVFFTKCVDKILEFHRAGKTLLCVSHATAVLENLCGRAIWLDHGRLVQDGPVSAVIHAYQESAARRSLQAVL
jgi:ABC-type polysaccharide/polyol phosphate transport system ATPase subunit